LRRLFIRNAYNILVRNPEGKRPLGIPRCARKDNTRMGIKEIKWKGVDWVHLILDRDQRRAVVNTAMNLRVP
jgi:hypothetical protein